MNVFNLGAEVLIMPALWGILALTCIVMTVSSFKRNRTIVEGEDGEPIVDKVEWKRNGARLRRAGIIALGGTLILASLVVVPPGHRGAVYTTSGVSTVERGEGYSVILPIVNNVTMVNVREQVYENTEVFAQTSDLLEVTMQIGVNFFVSPDMAADVFRNVGQDYTTALIKPAVLDIAKEAAGRIDALDFPNEREELAQAILTGLRARLEPLGITVTFVAIQDAIFPTDFVTAVRNKEIAAEKAEESLRLVQVAVNEAQQMRERANGDADAIKALADAEREQQDLLGLSPSEYIWYKVWNGQLPTTVLSETGSFIVDLPTPTPAPAQTEEEGN